ncbi:MAG: type II secretion system protein [Acidobacteriota bacterium]
MVSSTVAGEGRGARAGGFTVLGLLVLVAIVNVTLALAATSWVTIDRRAREAELIWRGQQYVRAINCYQRDKGEAPTDLEDLIEADCIRRLWPDPMSKDGEWQVIRASQARAAGDGSRGSAVGAQGPPGLKRSGRGRRAGGNSAAIVGVASRSDRESLRLYRGKRHYNEWEFVVASARLGR